MSTLMTQLLALAERVGQEAKALREAMQSGGAVIGEIKLMGFAAVPDGWLVCNGAALPTTSYPQLYEKIGTTFGGGAGTYVLPNFKTALPRQAGDGLVIGATSSAGTSVELPLSFTLTEANLPSHTHTAKMIVSASDATSPSALWEGYLASGSTEGTSVPNLYAADRDGGQVDLSGDTVQIASAGDGSPVSTNADVTLPATMPPVVGVNYVIYAGAAA